MNVPFRRSIKDAPGGNRTGRLTSDTRLSATSQRLPLLFSHFSSSPRHSGSVKYCIKCPPASHLTWAAVELAIPARSTPQSEISLPTGSRTFP